MATEVREATILAAPTDALRIVPLVGSGKASGVVGAMPAAAPPQMTYRGGSLLTSVQVFTVFWGSAWQSQQSALAQSLNQFFDAILVSPLIDQLAEYNVPGYAIGHGTRTGTATVTTPALHKTCTDARLRHMLQQEITTNRAFPPPSPNTLYFVFLAPGVSLSMGGGRSCLTFCGYHETIQGQIFYAAMPFAGCAGCSFGGSILDSTTIVASHELCEAITDPVPGQGWYDDHNGEIGDPCESSTKKIGQYMVQKVWSNKNNSCT